MSDKVFLDSNVLVYAYDSSDRSKQAKAQELLERGIREDSAVVSAQVLGEFFIAVTRKIAHPMRASEAAEAVEILSAIRVIEVDRMLVNEAIGAHQRYGISYWDGLILAAAERAGCRRVLSEDLNAGQEYGRVAVENPFY
jgi:predicted nucleic acid-binding protein